MPLVYFVVVVGFPGHDRLFFEVERRGRRRCHPFQARCIPRIVGRGLAVTHRPQEVEHWQEIADTEYGGASGGKYVEHLELWHVAVIGIATRHAKITENKLREEGQVKSDEND